MSLYRKHLFIIYVINCMHVKRIPHGTCYLLQQRRDEDFFFAFLKNIHPVRSCTKCRIERFSFFDFL